MKPLRLFHKDTLFWCGLLIGLISFYVVKFLSPQWIQWAFDHQQFEWLNRLTDVKSPQSLDFYQGRLAEVIFGPLAQVTSGVCFAIFTWRYLLKQPNWMFGLAVFIFLLITKFEILFFPPYGDAIGGPFAEGIWLYKNHFDYIGLFHQPNFAEGGPKVYFFSLYPTFLALCYSILPSMKIFLVFQHLFCFMLTAIMAAMTRACLQFITDEKSANLSAIVMLGLPLIQSQTEAINMEIPSAFFMLWSAYALLRRQFVLATVMAILSAWVKGTGVSACIAATIILVGLWIFEKNNKARWQMLVCAVLMGLNGAVLVILKFIFKDAHVKEGMIRWASGWPSLQKEFIFYLFLGCTVLTGMYFLSRRRLSKSNHYIPVVMIVYTAMWFLLFFNFYAVSPRYRVTVYPFLIFCVVQTLCLLIAHLKVRQVILGVAIIAAFFSSYGVYYGTMPDNDHVLLERSLEYRNDLQVSLKLVDLIEKKYADQLIVAPFTIAQALAIPELGYVHKKIDVMIYGFGLKYGGIKNFPGLKYLDPMRTLFVGDIVAPLPNHFPYPMGPKDVLIDEVRCGNKMSNLFVGGFYIDALWRVTHPSAYQSSLGGQRGKPL